MAQNCLATTLLFFETVQGHFGVGFALLMSHGGTGEEAGSNLRVCACAYGEDSFSFNVFDNARSFVLSTWYPWAYLLCASTSTIFLFERA